MLFGLNEPEQEEIETKQIEKNFDYVEDIEELGKKLDNQNRKSFLKEECDSLFIASTDVLDDINTLKEENNPDFSKRLEKIKEEALNEEMLFTAEDIDIFGGITEDKTRINTLGNTKHRELKKSKYKILEINKNTGNEQYINTLRELTSYLDRALNKSKFGIKLDAYFASTGALTNEKYTVLYINPQNAIDTLKEFDKINLYKIKINENSKGIALTNIVYYENANKTLPIGMSVSDKVVVNMSDLKLEPKKQKLFRINQEINDVKVQTKIICVYEYEVMEEQ